MKKAILTLALAASAFTAASAQEMPRAPGGGMMRADANGDGIITRAESLAEAGARFDRIDTNRDGKIDQAELMAMADRRGRRAGQPPAPSVPAK